MTKAELVDAKKLALQSNKYEMHYFKGWNYQKLRKWCSYSCKRGKNHNDETYSDCIIMADTETSKTSKNAIKMIKGEKSYIPVTNYVVAFTVSLRIYGYNIVTLYGHDPEEFCYCIKLIMDNLPGDNIIVYFHNLAYDYVFLRKFLYKNFGEPETQLATKSHYPVQIKFSNGLILKDSLILAQRSLDKWAKDMQVEHQKALGKWDYDKIRTQKEEFTIEELEYIEHDTLAGVECIEMTMELLNKRLLELPLTATGIPREATLKLGKKNRAKDRFMRSAPDLSVQGILESVFHGGYTHGNRHLINQVLYGDIKCKDFSSSYPFCMLAYKYPVGKFTPLENCKPAEILEKTSEYAFIFKLVLLRPMLKDYNFPMPALQYSKAVKLINPIVDNGRILGAEYCEIYLNEIDLEVILNQYKYDEAICTNVYYSWKDYLPRWFTDYVYSLYVAKTQLKGLDPVLYALKKATLNSCYGMCVQKPLRDEIQEDYSTGEYSVKQRTATELQEEYEKFLKNKNKILPFQWGCWVTSYAHRNLFKLGECAGVWIYSDTDSVYGQKWNEEKVNQYNENCKRLLKENGYGAVIHNGREYWLGIAEADAEYSEFMVQGAKRYCGRSTEDGELHITVAGVPKKGAVCLNNDIHNFTSGFVFDGETTGKKTHTYMFVDKIYTDKKGNLIGDSIDLTPCDYKLDGVIELIDWQDLMSPDITIQTFEEDYYGV